MGCRTELLTPRVIVLLKKYFGRINAEHLSAFSSIFIDYICVIASVPFIEMMK